MPTMPAGSRCRITPFCGARIRMDGRSSAARPTDLSAALCRRPEPDTPAGRVAATWTPSLRCCRSISPRSLRSRSKLRHHARAGSIGCIGLLTRGVLRVAPVDVVARSSAVHWRYGRTVGASRTPRSRGYAGRHRCLPSCRRRCRSELRRPCRQVHGRRTPSQRPAATNRYDQVSGTQT